jgi:hypothetical protein
LTAAPHLASIPDGGYECGTLKAFRQGWIVLAAAMIFVVL